MQATHKQRQALRIDVKRITVTYVAAVALLGALVVNDVLIMRLLFAVLLALLVRAQAQTARRMLRIYEQLLAG